VDADESHILYRVAELGRGEVERLLCDLRASEVDRLELDEDVDQQVAQQPVKKVVRSPAPYRELVLVHPLDSYAVDLDDARGARGQGERVEDRLHAFAGAQVGEGHRRYLLRRDVGATRRVAQYRAHDACVWRESSHECVDLRDRSERAQACAIHQVGSLVHAIRVGSLLVDEGACTIEKLG